MIRTLGARRTARLAAVALASVLVAAGCSSSKSASSTQSNPALTKSTIKIGQPMMRENACRVW